MKVTIKLSRSIQIIDPKDILYIVAKGSYSLIIKVNGESIKVSKNLLALKTIFKNYKQLQKCHRSYIANVNFVNTVNTIGPQKYILRLQNNELIPLSISFRQNFLKHIKDQY